jgi:hypothetical protein
MFKQNIHIINFEILYKILYEIKNNLNFNILKYDTEHDFLSTHDIDNKNSLIIVNPNNKNLINNDSVDKRIFIKLKELPFKLNDLIQNINVQLIKQRYNYQSHIAVKEYSVDLNSRIIKNKNKNLKLTQKEIDIILFLNEIKEPQKINLLQKKIWNYTTELETHTVETHIYRLRKKIKDVFNDDNFIISHKDGYLIK